MAVTILVVEDSRVLRQMIRQALEQDAHAVIEAEDGERALAAIRRTPVELMITDINMPKLDGLSLIRAVRAFPEYRALPVLVLTTEAADAVMQRGRDAGANGWLVKPFSNDKLRSTVTLVLNGAAAR